jgi:flagellar biosynthesis protein FlhA
VTTTESITEQASTQLANPTALFISAAILVILGMVPGMPHLMFITLSVAAAGLGLMIISKEVQEEQAVQAEKDAAPAEGPKELDWDDVDQVDLIGLEIGYGLIPLVNAETG